MCFACNHAGDRVTEECASERKPNELEQSAATLVPGPL